MPMLILLAHTLARRLAEVPNPVSYYCSRRVRGAGRPGVFAKGLSRGCRQGHTKATDKAVTAATLSPLAASQDKIRSDGMSERCGQASESAPRLDLGELSGEDLMRSIRLLGEKVIRAFDVTR